MFSDSTFKTEAPLYYPVLPETIKINILSRYSSNVNVMVHEQDFIETGTVLAKGNTHEIHSSIPGIISKIDSSQITIKNSSEKISWLNSFKKTGFISNPSTHYQNYLKEIGLLGMGGALFPASLKIKAAADCHTLIINAVECEPFITTDISILLHHSEWIKKGVEATIQNCNIEKVVLAIQNHPSLITKLKKIYSYPLMILPQFYPAGSERLIIQKITRNLPSFKHRPTDFGFLVQNVSSLRAIGRSLIDNIPVIERPLTLAVPEKKIQKNIIVPIGITAREIFEHYSIPFNEEKELIVFSGLMMGENKSLNDPVTKGTNSIFIISKQTSIKKQRACIQCGNCIDACPLGLHPILMANRIKKKEQTRALNLHLQECFLCGKCEAVCPSYIPLVDYFKEAKQWSLK